MSIPSTSNTAKKFFISIKTLSLSLVVGGILGLIGLVVMAIVDGVGVFGLIGVFGGIGLILSALHADVLLLPVIHCTYAYIILRFQFRGIFVVVALHYLSIILITTIWAILDLPSYEGSLGMWTDICQDITEMRENFTWDPLFAVAINGVRFVLIAVPIIFYNGILFFLLWRATKKTKSNISADMLTTID
jgi:hypothetical protein